MAPKGIIELVRELQAIADGECTCTSEQQTGKDPTTCRRCKAAHKLNEIGELLEE